jgi:hypothetical protein
MVIVQNPVILSVTQSSSIRGNNIFDIFRGNAGNYELVISKPVYSVVDGSPAVNGSKNFNVGELNEKPYGQICSFLHNSAGYVVC